MRNRSRTSRAASRTTLTVDRGEFTTSTGTSARREPVALDEVEDLDVEGEAVDAGVARTRAGPTSERNAFSPHWVSR